MTTAIENVLAAKDPSVTDENEWEEFSLTDVKARLPGKSRYANILSASPEFPVTVTGQLEIVEEDQEHLVLDEKYRSKRVLIENVTHYAYGQHDDGDVGIWVAGSAGWFSITPAKGYKPMFYQMVEAIDLLYFLADKHQRKGRRKTQWNPKVDFLFNEYSKHTNGACADAEESAEVFDQHHDFLVTQMYRGREGIDWTSTPIYLHLRENFPEVFERLEQAAQASSNDEQHDASDPETEESMDDDTDANEKERAQAETIFEVITDMKESGLLSKRKLNFRSLAEAILARYEMNSLEDALNLISARAEYIIEMMRNAQEPSFDWSRKVIYRELQAASTTEGVDAIGTTPLHPRQMAGLETPQSAESSEDEGQPAKGRRRRARKSLLRPKLSSVSAKRTGKRNRQIDAEVTDSEAEAEDYLENNETPSKSHGHKLVHNALSAKLNESAQSINSHSVTPSLNRTTLQDGLEVGTELELRNGDDFLGDDESGSLEIPPDTWICPAPDCAKTIFKASSKRGKEQISDHSLVHANDTQTRLNLVLAEQRLNVNASVTNLLSRIQDSGPTQDPFTTIQNALHDLPTERESSPNKKVKL